MSIIEIIKFGAIIIGACGSGATFRLFLFRIKENKQGKLEKLEKLIDKLKKSRILVSEDYQKILVKLDLPNHQNIRFWHVTHDGISDWLITSNLGLEVIALQMTYVTNSVDEFYIILNLLKELSVKTIKRKLLQEISKYYINFEQAILAYESKMEKLKALNLKFESYEDRDFNSMFITKLFDYPSCFKFKEVIHLVENLIPSLEKKQKFTEIHIEVRRFLQRIRKLFLYPPEYQKQSIPKEKSS